MGSSSGGSKKSKNWNWRSRQRAHMSFFIVVMFFGVFGVIVFTEVFFIDENGRNGGSGRHGGPGTYGRSGQGHDYENDDYMGARVGVALGGGPMGEDEGLARLLIGRPAPAALPFQDADPAHPAQMIGENLLPTYPENFTATEGSWQNITGSRYKFFVFSAYYDGRRNQKFVRVVGATRTRRPERVFCRMWYKSNEANSTQVTSKTVPAAIKVIRENWNLRYSACFVLCPLKNVSIPFAVSIVTRIRDIPSNLLMVLNNYNDTKIPKSRFGVCVKPLHFDYNKETQMLEFLELNRLLGVEYFTFYNHTVGPQVDCILKDYISRGIVSVLPWDLNMLSQKEIRTEGLFAALNDCLYRSMYSFSHVLLIDLDEYIIPKNNDTLPQLIEYLGRRSGTSSTGAFSFQNAFFYLQWADDEEAITLGRKDPVASNLVTLSKTRRRSKLHPHKQRSKYICRPERVVEAGNHFVWEFAPGHGSLNVPQDAAILHHYRICEFGGDDCIKTTSVVDKTAYKYKEALTTAVRREYDRLRNRCDLTDLRPPPARVFDKIIGMLKAR